MNWTAGAGQVVFIHQKQGHFPTTPQSVFPASQLLGIRIDNQTIHARQSTTAMAYRSRTPLEVSTTPGTRNFFTTILLRFAGIYGYMCFLRK